MIKNKILIVIIGLFIIIIFIYYLFRKDSKEKNRLEYKNKNYIKNIKEISRLLSNDDRNLYLRLEIMNKSYKDLLNEYENMLREKNFNLSQINKSGYDNKNRNIYWYIMVYELESEKYIAISDWRSDLDEMLWDLYENLEIYGIELKSWDNIYPKDIYYQEQAIEKILEKIPSNLGIANLITGEDEYVLTIGYIKELKKAKILANEIGEEIEVYSSKI